MVSLFLLLGLCDSWKRNRTIKGKDGDKSIIGIAEISSGINREYILPEDI